MHESRKTIMVLVSVLLLGLTVGMAHADAGSADGMNLDPRNQPVTENSVVDFAGDSSVTAGKILEADAETLEPAVEKACPSDTALTAALGLESALPVLAGQSGWTWTCGSCSINPCKNVPVGTRCGFNKFCVVTTVCSSQPLTERCVCGTDHY